MTDPNDPAYQEKLREKAQKYFKERFGLIDLGEEKDFKLEALVFLLASISADARRDALEHAALQADIYFGVNTGPDEAWKAGELIGDAIRSLIEKKEGE